MPPIYLVFTVQWCLICIMPPLYLAGVQSSYIMPPICCQVEVVVKPQMGWRVPFHAVNDWCEVHQSEEITGSHQTCNITVVIRPPPRPSPHSMASQIAWHTRTIQHYLSQYATQDIIVQASYQDCGLMPYCLYFKLNIELAPTQQHMAGLSGLYLWWSICE